MYRVPGTQTRETLLIRDEESPSEQRNCLIRSPKQFKSAVAPFPG